MHFRRCESVPRWRKVSGNAVACRIQVGVLLRELSQAEKEKEGSVVAWLTDLVQNSIVEVDPLLTTHQPDR
jgi:hypothetical protein